MSCLFCCPVAWFFGAQWCLVLLLWFLIGSGYVQNGGAELLHSCFRAMAVVIKQFENYKINESQIKVLLGAFVDVWV